MSGANIFMIYAGSDEKKVTLSPRLGYGNFQPEASNSSQAVLLSGSGISDGKMTANVRCKQCFHNQVQRSPSLCGWQAQIVFLGCMPSE